MAAPDFATPEPLELSEAEATRIADLVCEDYRTGVESRTAWEANHEEYDQMFRGRTAPRVGPWEGASDLHIQMPYWVVDAVNVRMVSGVWSQVPLVGGKAEEDDDEEIFKNAASLVDWHLQPKRIGARAVWNRISKTRCIHGVGVGLLSYVVEDETYRVKEYGVDLPVFNPDGSLQVDDEGNPIRQREESIVEKTNIRYDGPVFTPLDWDDVVPSPVGCMNLQPMRPSNPRGAKAVVVRQYEHLDLMVAKDYPELNLNADGELTDREWWIQHAPSQDRSSGGATGGSNTRRVRQQDRQEGINRAQASRQRQVAHSNPEYEILTYFGSDQGEERIYVVAAEPRKTLAAFRLNDVYYKGWRPLIEMHYQTVGTRWYSMGVMEIVKHLSAELDTIHNMRLDVGFATNMPFFFYRAASSFDPEEVEIRPLKGVPVDNVNDIIFPNINNVTSFYVQEEQLLYTLIERVVGVTDLFLGISPTRGAAARHATGFVGTQQEALARTSEVQNQDAEAFSALCRMIYELEMQYGPDYRSFRLKGKKGPMSHRLTRNGLWMRGEYDFRLGANQGSYSAMVDQQRAQGIMQVAAASPLTNQEMGRRWEVEKDYYDAIGVPDPERFIGPKEAVSQGQPKSQDEEIGEMVQFKYGMNTAAPVHPSDNDTEHMQEINAWVSSPEFDRLGRPNELGIMQHAQLHMQQMRQKQMQAQAQAQQAMQAPGQQPPGSAPQAQNGQQDRMMPQMLAQGNAAPPAMGGGQQGQGQAPAGGPPTIGGS